MIDINKDDLKQGLLGLVMALVEIIKEVVETQAIKRMESGALTEREIERLGEALLDLDEAINKIKSDNNIHDTVQSVRDGLDNLVDDVLDKMINPERWAEDVE
ncbi:MAG: gas vesicle protein K [Firmicutes bacterium]|nr:gas vesicle protein K [Bacillota bacterium]